jgi:hypothetical protein
LQIWDCWFDLCGCTDTVNDAEREVEVCKWNSIQLLCPAQLREKRNPGSWDFYEDESEHPPLQFVSSESQDPRCIRQSSHKVYVEMVPRILGLVRLPGKSKSTGDFLAESFPDPCTRAGTFLSAVELTISCCFSGDRVGRGDLSTGGTPLTYSMNF